MNGKCTELNPSSSMITLNVTDKIEIFLSGEENMTQQYAVSKRFTVYTKPQQFKSKSVRILFLLILSETPLTAIKMHWDL